MNDFLVTPSLPNTPERAPRSRWEQALFVGLLGLLAFSALAHGVVEQWSVLVFELWTVVLLLLWTCHAVAQRQVAFVIPPTFWPLLGLFIVGLLQSIARTDADGVRQSLSMDVEATRQTMMTLACLLVCLLLATNVLGRGERFETLAHCLTIYGLAMAVFAVAQHFTWNGRFYWLRAVQADNAFGTFVNRNHFAGYMELLLPWPVALMLMRRRERGEQFFYGFAAAWMGVAAILSLSRGGWLSIVAELLLLALLSVRRKTHSDMPQRQGGLAWLRDAGAVLVLLAVILGGVVWLGAEGVVNRLATGDENGRATSVTSISRGGEGSRREIWRDTWAVFRAHPLTGAGLGAFETAYAVHGRNSGLARVVGQAHNDYLQVLADAGIVGAGLALWFLALVAMLLARGWQTPEPVARGVALASGAGIFGLLVHSLFDFNLQLISHALLLLTLTGVLWRAGEFARQPLTELAASQASVSPLLTWARRNQS